ncbi:MAG: 7-carboxy-7-deazaguanine synthase QueE, partial [Planctomycetes bacterium]|nr:7-carboxy-7-deazaguanine synthase QueE [Planctomycetota bacterium]
MPEPMILKQSSTDTDTYIVKEIFTSLQGEGLMMGTPATFIRFARCNMNCAYCDTDYAGGQWLEISDIVKSISTEWVWITGGEPLLQVGHQADDPLLSEIRNRGHRIALETNGSLRAGFEFDHIALSPKVHRSECKLDHANEIKVIYPASIHPEEYHDFGGIGLDGKRFIQPTWGFDDSHQDCVEYFLGHPEWRLSVQM